eukprot:749532-Hanusia_phi.AAC.3
MGGGGDGWILGSEGMRTRVCGAWRFHAPDSTGWIKEVRWGPASKGWSCAEEHVQEWEGSESMIRLRTRRRMGGGWEEDGIDLFCRWSLSTRGTELSSYRYM